MIVLASDTYLNQTDVVLLERLFCDIHVCFIRKKFEKYQFVPILAFNRNIQMGSLFQQIMFLKIDGQLDHFSISSLIHCISFYS